MQAIHSVQIVEGPFLSVPMPPELKGKRVDVVITELEPMPELTPEERQIRLQEVIAEKPAIHLDLERQWIEKPNLLEGSVLKYDDPFGPACPPEDWEALS